MIKRNYNFISKLMITIFVLLLLLTVWFVKTNSATIVIGSKNFTEQRILAEMIGLTIEEDNDIDVQIKSGLGETSFLNEALNDGDIDLYVDYSSNGFEGVLKQTYNGQSSAEINSYLNEEYNAKFNSSWISFIGFENTNSIICKEYCTENNIKTMSDLAGKEFTFGAPPNFYVRSDGFNLIEEGYDVNLTDSDKLKMDSVLIYQAVSHGDVDAGLAFTTDGRLQTDDYTILHDDKGVFPKYDAGIIVNNDSLAEHSGLEETLKKFNGLISTEEMSELNYQVDVKGNDPKVVAKEFLQEKNLID